MTPSSFPTVHVSAGYYFTHSQLTDHPSIYIRPILQDAKIIILLNHLFEDLKNKHINCYRHAR